MQGLGIWWQTLVGLRKCSVPKQMLVGAAVCFISEDWFSIYKASCGLPKNKIWCFKTKEPSNQNNMNGIKNSCASKVRQDGTASEHFQYFSKKKWKLNQIIRKNWQFSWLFFQEALINVCFPMPLIQQGTKMNVKAATLPTYWTSILHDIHHQIQSLCCLSLFISFNCPG